MIIIALEILGLTILVTEIISIIKNYRLKKILTNDATWRKLYWWSWIIGFPLAIASVFMVYGVKSDSGDLYKILGVPFVAGAFDSKGADFVSSLTPVFMLLNMTFWFLTPQLYMWVWSFRVRKEVAARPNGRRPGDDRKEEP